MTNNKGYPNTRDQQAGYELYKLYSWVFDVCIFIYE